MWRLLTDCSIRTVASDSSHLDPATPTAPHRPTLMPPVNTSTGSVFDASRPWALHPQVTLRPEPFGALAYHFGTRRLSFLKSPTLVAVVGRLADEPTARAACRTARVDPTELASYEQALGTLAASGMIRPRDELGTTDPRDVP